MRTSPLRARPEALTPDPAPGAGLARRLLVGALAATIAWTSPAQAADTLEIGVLRDEDIHVVQKLLYPKAGRSEMGAHIGLMPFDAYVTTPNVQLSYARHMNERFAFSMVVGGGYGLKTGTYRTLESPTYGVAPYAYRYLGSVLAGVEYAPIYAKLNLDGARIVHFDVYGTLKAGVSLEQSVLPDATIGAAPTLSPGIGARFFVGDRSALHVAFRDDLLLQRRALTQSTELKQNANVTVGFTVLTAAPERR